jgi:hypothetical protein
MRAALERWTELDRIITGFDSFERLRSGSYGIGSSR